MNKKNLEVLGLSEGATESEIKAAYESLRAKYLEERFMDGETGNNAAKMLTKIEAAYSALLNEIAESAATSSGGGSSYANVEELIKSGDLQAAQHALDAFDERTAQWHYLQSLVFFRKNWVNESKKQLEIAIQLDPDNAQYNETYRKLNEHISTQNTDNRRQGNYEAETMNYSAPEEQMGGGFCDSCLRCIACNMCLNCFCNGCCR